VHPHAAFAAIGACSGVATARRYKETQVLSMLTAASTAVHPGPFGQAVGGSFMRNIWVANGSKAGLQIADWIHVGIEGLDQSLLQVFKEILGFNCLPEQLTQNLSTDWAILANFHKIYPCCQFAHSAIEAIAALLPCLPDRYQASVGAQLKGIRIEVHEKARVLNNYEPVSMLAARFSLPHIVAVMVVHGVIDTQTLSSASLCDAAVIKVRKLVKIEGLKTTHPPPNDRACRVYFSFRDGEEYESECLCARGSQSNPLALDVLKQKIHEITARSYPKLHLIMERLIGLEEHTLKLSWAEIVSLMKDEEL